MLLHLVTLLPYIAIGSTLLLTGTIVAVVCNQPVPRSNGFAA